MIKINWGAQKGKSYDKLPLKTLAIFDTMEYYVSTKYDGNQIFIAKQGNWVRWFTSDWKEFDLPKIGHELKEINGDFVIVAEMNYHAEGKLGDRTKVQGKITTERVNFRKGLPCSLDERKVSIKAFDMVEFDSYGIANLLYKDRIEQLGFLIPQLPHNIQVVANQLMTGLEAKIHSKALAMDGWEGCMCMEPNHYYHMDKRVNHAIKLKDRPTADLLCIGVTDGEDKYEGMIGALELKDKQGRRVNVGSGLSDDERGHHEDCFLGKIIEISYEQILDTYQQPVYNRVRDDKHTWE